MGGFAVTQIAGSTGGSATAHNRALFDDNE